MYCSWCSHPYKWSRHILDSVHHLDNILPTKIAWHLPCCMLSTRPNIVIHRNLKLNVISLTYSLPIFMLFGFIFAYTGFIWLALLPLVLKILIDFIAALLSRSFIELLYFYMFHSNCICIILFILLATTASGKCRRDKCVKNILLFDFNRLRRMYT